MSNSNINEIFQEQDKVDDAEEQYLEKLISQLVKRLRDGGFNIPESHVSFMGQILRVEDYSVERAAKLALKTYDAALILHDELKDYTPSKYYHLFGSQGIFKVLKGRDEFNHCVAVMHWGKWNPEELSNAEAIAGLTIFFQWAQKKSPVTQRNGTVLVNDLTGFGMRHFRAINIGLMKKAMTLGQTHTPAKVDSLHYLFTPRICDLLFLILRPFLVERLRDRVYLHSELSSFHRYVKPEILPECLGGTLGEIEAVDNDLHKTFEEGGAEFVHQFVLDAFAVSRVV